MTRACSSQGTVSGRAGEEQSLPRRGIHTLPVLSTRDTWDLVF